ncbi:VOC family protein [Vibrio sp. WXL103]|uniref:VOC family protein n=1 Tax=unclassified Vibrio TaxID=2614977 RepID=UPI003EC79357
MTKLEHANITVPSIDAAIEFLDIVAPDFEVRADNSPQDSYRWAHVGNSESYLALQEPQLHQSSAKNTTKDQRRPYYDIGVNHLALIVSDVEGIKERLLERGYRMNGEIADEISRKRVYFWDSAGFEWELVEYFTQEPKQRYRYDNIA